MMSGGRGGLTSVGSLRKEIQEAKNKDTDLSVLADQYKEQSMLSTALATDVYRLHICC